MPINNVVVAMKAFFARCPNGAFRFVPEVCIKFHAKTRSYYLHFKSIRGGNCQVRFDTPASAAQQFLNLSRAFL